MIKGLLGYFLTGAGLVAMILLVQRNLSGWYIMLVGIIFFMGLDFIISNKIADAKDEIMEKIDERIEEKLDEMSG